MSAIKTETILIGGGVLLAAFAAYKLLPKLAKTAGGLVSGNNAITQNATDASGNKTTAYQGAGVAGTVGAATNAASGGTLASIGDWLGGGFYDLIHGDPFAQQTPVNPAPANTSAAVDKYQQGGNAATGSGSSLYDLLYPEDTGYGFNWGS